MSIPRGWKFERIDENTILVNDPCKVVALEVTVNSSDRRVSSFYNLVVDLMQADKSESEFNHGFVSGAVAFQQVAEYDTTLKFDDNLWDERDE
jgi:hypothetical protein